MPQENWEDAFDDGTLKDSIPKSIEPQRSRLRLDEPQAFIDKLAVNVVVIFVGLPVVASMFVAAADLKAFPIIQEITTIFAESLTAFLLLAMIYVWFKPPWFRKLYLFVESKFIVALICFGAVFIVWLLGLMLL